MGELDRVQLEILLERAAEKGAEECLHRMGINEDNIHEVKDMLEVFKAVKKGILQGITRIIMIVIVGTVVAAGAWWSFGH